MKGWVTPWSPDLFPAYKSNWPNKPNRPNKPNKSNKPNWSH